MDQLQSWAMSRTIAWFALASSIALIACGDDSANQPGSTHNATYDKDAASADSSYGACECSPMTLDFGQSDGFSVVAVTLDESTQSCALSPFDEFSAAFGFVDPGESTITGAFGGDWTPSNPSAGTLSEVAMGWQWTGIPFDTPVAVTVTHPSGIAATVEFEINKTDATTLTIVEACFHAA